MNTPTEVSIGKGQQMGQLTWHYDRAIMAWAASRGDALVGMIWQCPAKEVPVAGLRWYGSTSPHWFRTCREAKLAFAGN